MAFRRLPHTTLQQVHFCDNQYSFLVDSVLEPQPEVGELLPEVSEGSELKSVADGVPALKRALGYVARADGRLVAQAMVTMLAKVPLLMRGHLTLKEPLGEPAIVNVQVSTVLSVDPGTICFGEIEPGQQVCALVKINQRGATTPVAVIIDGGGEFGLARTSTELVFTNRLVLTPAPGGTYVYVRYAPTQPGHHTASLLTESPYATQMVALSGQTGFVAQPRHAWLRGMPGGIGRRWPITLPLTVQQWQTGLLMLLVCGCLYTGYILRHEFAADLYRPELALVPARTTRDYDSRLRFVTLRSKTPAGFISSANTFVSSKKLTRILIFPLGTNKDSAPTVKSDRPVEGGHLAAQARVSIASQNTSGESELEQALNSSNHPGPNRVCMDKGSLNSILKLITR